MWISHLIRIEEGINYMNFSSLYHLFNSEPSQLRLETEKETVTKSQPRVQPVFQCKGCT